MKSQMQSRSLKLVLVAVGVVELTIAVWWFVHKPAPAAVGPVEATKVVTTISGAVSAPGKFEPAEPVTHVGAPYIEGHPAMVAAIKVSEGETIKTGQVLAELDGKSAIEAAMHQDEARVSLSEARLAQVKASPRNGDAAAQKAEIARWQLAYDTAQTEYQRYDKLRLKHDVSASELDAKRAEMENAQRMVEESQARLASLSETRPEDLKVADAELNVERAALERERTELANTTVRSPADGVVLHVYARNGEEVGPLGILELADTTEMCVVAEVYETDIQRVAVGEKAEITSELLPGQTLAGTVAAVGREIGRTDLISSDPAAFADSRVVRVRIQLAESRTAAGLIHGKVTVVMRP